VTQRLFEQDAYLRECRATVTGVTNDGVILDQTVFYALGGGQPGDRGRLILSDGQILGVLDTRKAAGSEIEHKVDAAALAQSGGDDLIGSELTAVIDWPLRHAHMRMHTALHLLCAVVAAPVTGGNLTAQKGRLDFDLPEATVDKDSLTRALNELINSDVETSLQWITEEQMAAQPELVKTLSVAPPTGAGLVRLLNIPGIDLQPCGGTHVRRLGEIGPVRVSKIEKKSRLNRRISVVFDPAD
jgi:misacylated tRNA(Ala) deacylase